MFSLFSVLDSLLHYFWHLLFVVFYSIVLGLEASKGRSQPEIGAAGIPLDSLPFVLGRPL